MMTLRVTNSTTIDLNDVIKVEYTGTGFRVAMKDGTVKRWRTVQLTPEAKLELAAMVAV